MKKNKGKSTRREFEEGCVQIHWVGKEVGEETNPVQEWGRDQISEKKKEIRQKQLNIRHSEWQQGCPGRKII